NEAKRHSLTVPFKWPVRLFNLKRCLLVQTVPVGEDRQLVLINFHLEAYETGEGRAVQLQELLELMQELYDQGNYVIAGGDFNHNLPGANYRLLDKTWQPGNIRLADLPEGWRLANDPSTPTSRLNNHPFTGDLDQTQLFGIDGFIVSPNVEVSEVTTINESFKYSDHNPVMLTAKLLD
ncbi:MAG: hypothetical protein FWG16_06930, partial [Micrococcales bacterium]|nr:hypothetical protein [Micrococcales bacterium]